MITLRHIKVPAALLAAIFSAQASADSYFGKRIENDFPTLQTVTRTKPPQPTPSPTPSPSPSAAKRSPEPQMDPDDPSLTVADWQRIAVQRFPDLKNPISALNKEFVQRVADLKNSNPAYFSNPKWPLLLARSIAAASPTCISGGKPATGSPKADGATTANQSHPPEFKKSAELKPFDALDRENIRIEGKIQEAAQPNGPGKLLSTITTAKVIVITVIQPGKLKIPVKVAAFFVCCGRGQESFIPIGADKIFLGDGSATFSNPPQNSAASTDDNKTGPEQQIVGWLAWATSTDGRTLGIAGSSEKYLALAKNPKNASGQISKND